MNFKIPLSMHCQLAMVVGPLLMRCNLQTLGFLKKCRKVRWISNVYPSFVTVCKNESATGGCSDVTLVCTCPPSKSGMYRICICTSVSIHTFTTPLAHNIAQNVLHTYSLAYVEY